MSRIALIGLPGSGKSLIGQLLSNRLDYAFVDLDQAIQESAGETIPHIFQAVGEAGFRALEREELIRVALEHPGSVVVATGGGIVVTPDCREQLRREFTTVYLQATIETLTHRLSCERDGRPLLRGDEPLEHRLTRLTAERARHYENTAHLRVPVDHLPPEQVVQKIMVGLGCQ